MSSLLARRTLLPFNRLKYDRLCISSAKSLYYDTKSKLKVRRFHSSSKGTGNVGVVFDIDGVLLRGKNALGRSKESLEKLKKLNIPFAFMTNGGGDFESVKAEYLEQILDLDLQIDAEKQIILAHTPMRQLVEQHGEERVLILGCRNEIEVAKHYGFTKVVTPQQYVSEHSHLGVYPFSSSQSEKNEFQDHADLEESIGAIIIMHDPVDWHLEIQVCCDILQGVDPLGHRQYDFPRFAQGAFLHTLSHIYSLQTGEKLDIVRYGKPNKVTYDYAEKLLFEQLSNEKKKSPFEVIYLIGDNPDADIKGTVVAGHPWHGILVRTGVYDDGMMDPQGAKHICDGVGEAVDYIISRNEF